MKSSKLSCRVNSFWSLSLEEDAVEGCARDFPFASFDGDAGAVEPFATTGGGTENVPFAMPSKSRAVGGALCFHISAMLRRFLISEVKTCRKQYQYVLDSRKR